VAAPSRAGQSLPLLRLRFAPKVEPFYPVRPTAAALAPGAHLDVTLWLLGADLRWPMDDGAVAAWQVYSVHDDGLGPDVYEDALTSALASSGTTSFVLEYHAALAEARAYPGEGYGPFPSECTWDEQGRLTGCADAWGSNAYCEDAITSCALHIPITLDSDLKERFRTAQTPYATRWRARLRAGTRSTEWCCGPGEELPSYGGSAIYALSTGDCYPCDRCLDTACGAAPLADTDPALPTLLLLLALALALTRKRTVLSRRHLRSPGHDPARTTPRSI